MYVSVGTLTVAFSTDLHQIWNEPLGSESEELVRLGSKSKNAFPYFSPKNQNFGGDYYYDMVSRDGARYLHLDAPDLRGSMDEFQSRLKSR